MLVLSFALIAVAAFCIGKLDAVRRLSKHVRDGSIVILPARQSFTPGPPELWGKRIPEQAPLKDQMEIVAPGQEVAVEATLLGRSLGYSDQDIEGALAYNSGRCLEYLREQTGHTST